MIENSDKIVKTLEDGGVIVYVTDTVWGLGCLPNCPKAVQKIYDIKKKGKPKTPYTYVK
jgi:L-threonylcarbamoyladenylate synthase